LLKTKRTDPDSPKPGFVWFTIRRKNAAALSGELPAISAARYPE
jgi:hypothetical protein